MSVYAVSWAKRQRTGDPVRKHVLIALADYASEDGVSWPSQERLAFDTELSLRTIGRALKRLEADKFLYREKRERRRDGSRQTDVVRLAMPQPDTVTSSHPTTRQTVRSYRSQSPTNHHRNHHISLPIQGRDSSELDANAGMGDEL